jgi:hypothetical protein
MPARPARTALIALFLCYRASAQSPDLPGDIAVRLSSADQSRLGVATTSLAAIQSPETVDAIGRVLDIVALAQLEAEIATVAAAADASDKEARRLELLAADDQNASRQSLEAARAQALADASRLRLTQWRISLEWGAALTKLGREQRQLMIDRIAAGDAALMRVDPLQSSPVFDDDVQVKIAAEQQSFEIDTLGFAANTDLRMQTTGLLVLLHGSGARTYGAGRIVTATIDTGRQLTGVLLPRESLIRVDGATWVYLSRGSGRYLRRAVLQPVIQDEGWFVESRFEPGDLIVTQGVGSLFAVERSDESSEAD